MINKTGYLLISYTSSALIEIHQYWCIGTDLCTLDHDFIPRDFIVYIRFDACSGSNTDYQLHGASLLFSGFLREWGPNCFISFWWKLRFPVTNSRREGFKNKYNPHCVRQQILMIAFTCKKHNQESHSVSSKQVHKCSTLLGPQLNVCVIHPINSAATDTTAIQSMCSGNIRKECCFLPSYCPSKYTIPPATGLTSTL